MAAAAGAAAAGVAAAFAARSWIQRRWPLRRRLQRLRPPRWPGGGAFALCLRAAQASAEGGAAEAAAAVLLPFEVRRLLAEAQRRSAAVLLAQGIGTAAWQREAEEVRAASEDPDLWSDAARAKGVLLRLRRVEVLEKRAASCLDAAAEMEAALECAEMDEESKATFLQEAQAVYDKWATEIAAMEVEILLGGRYDRVNCQVNIFAGAGGDEACDWVCMLERMYEGFAKQKSWNIRRIDSTPGDMMGMKSVEFEVEGEFAYGMLRGEHGTHRLVRVWNGKRQTTFAGVEVVPNIDEGLLEFELKEADLKYETFRSGGKGGQNVNKVETGVRITHVPTGITSKCTEERSQLLNKAFAIKKLKERLLVAQELQQAEELSAVRGDLVAAQWGAQVRNYVLQPYTLIKDLRSGHERGDVDRVLAGDLGSYVDALLRDRATAAEAS